jgi:hypothetical protein
VPVCYFCSVTCLLSVALSLRFNPLAGWGGPCWRVAPRRQSRHEGSWDTDWEVLARPCCDRSCVDLPKLSASRSRPPFPPRGLADEPSLSLSGGLNRKLSNTTRQIGAALGVAIATTVAVTRSENYLAANEGANPLVVLNEGFQSAFVACVVLAGLGMALALVLLGRPRTATHEVLEPVPATGGGE